MIEYNEYICMNYEYIQVRHEVENQNAVAIIKEDFQNNEKYHDDVVLIKHLLLNWNIEFQGQSV